LIKPPGSPAQATLKIPSYNNILLVAGRGIVSPRPKADYPALVVPRQTGSKDEGTATYVGNIGKYKMHGRNIKNIYRVIPKYKLPAVYIAGAIHCGAEMLLLAAPPAISAVLAAL